MKAKTKLCLGYVFIGLFFPLIIVSAVVLIKTFPEGIVMNDIANDVAARVIFVVICFWGALISFVVGMNLLVSSGFYREGTQEEADREFQKQVDNMHM